MRKCNGCKQTKDEYYMLKPEVWIQACMKPVKNIPVISVLRMLCVSCVEKRLGRELNWRDFALCRLNLDPSEPRTAILQDRMSGITNRLPQWFFNRYGEDQWDVSALAYGWPLRGGCNEKHTDRKSKAGGGVSNQASS